MKPIRLFALSMVLILPACATVNDSLSTVNAGIASAQQKTRNALSTINTTISSSELVGAWKVDQLIGKSGKNIPVRAGLTLILQNGTVNGNGGCNNFSGRYSTTGTKIKFDSMASTEMACIDKAANMAEQQFLQNLSLTTDYIIKQQGLILLNNNQPLLVFKR